MDWGKLMCMTFVDGDNYFTLILHKKAWYFGVGLERILSSVSQVTWVC